jgi:hypothetical protein
MHVGRPNTEAPLATPARLAASFNSIANRGRQVNKTTSGATGAWPRGEYTTTAGDLVKRGICGNSSGFT